LLSRLPNGWPMCRRSRRDGLTMGEEGAVGTIGLLGTLDHHEGAMTRSPTSRFMADSMCASHLNPSCIEVERLVGHRHFVHLVQYPQLPPVESQLNAATEVIRRKQAHAADDLSLRPPKRRWPVIYPLRRSVWSFEPVERRTSKVKRVARNAELRNVDRPKLHVVTADPKHNRRRDVQVVRRLVPYSPRAFDRLTGQTTEKAAMLSEHVV
jgi:hypothetical protein